MLKSVIIQVKKVTCESSYISLLCKSKIQSHQLKAGMLKNEDVDAHKVLKKGWHDQNGFHGKLNVIQAYMKLYVMQG